MEPNTEQPVVVETPPVETPVEPQKVTFTPEQKDRINEIVKDASARAGSEARAEVERLRKLVPVTPAEPQSTDTATLLRLAQAESELSTLKMQAQESTLREALHTAAGTQPWFNSSIAESLLRNSVKMVNGVPTVVNADGTPRLNDAFEPMSMADLAKSVAEQHKFLVKSDFVGVGVGSIAGGRSPAQDPIPLDSVFGPHSSSAIATRLAMREPARYARMKVAARAKGLIP